MPRSKATGSRGRRGGGSIYYDKARRRYRAQVSVDGRARTIGSAVDHEGATAILNAYLAGDRPLPTPAAPVVAPRVSTVGEAVAWWRDEILPGRRRRGTRLAPSTINGYQWAAGYLIGDLGGVALDDLTTRHVNAFLADRVSRLSRNSLRVLRVTLNLVLDECVRHDDVRRNVARVSVLPDAAREVAERGALSVEECRALLVAAKGRDYEHLFALALTTGARRGELLGLSWKFVDLVAGTMTIRYALRKSASGGWEVGEPKTTASVRTVRLSEVAVDHLRARHAEQAREQLAAGARWLNSADLVFTTPTGAHVDPRRLARQWTALANAAGVDGRVFHELRHTVGSHAVDAGLPLAVVADQLGHGNLDEVSRVYRHRTAGVVEGVAGVMDAVLGEVGAG